MNPFPHTAVITDWTFPDLEMEQSILTSEEVGLAARRCNSESLTSGHLGAAALDVFDPEPIPAGHPLLSMPQVLLAPHIASCSVPAAKKLRESVARIAVAALRGQPLPTTVNGVKR